MMAFLRKSKFPMINIAIIITIANQNCFLLWSDVFIFGAIHYLSQGISPLINCAIPVIPKVRRTVAKVRQKLSWTDKIILIVGPIDRLTYTRKYFIFGKFSNNCQIKIFDHCSPRKFSLSSWKIPFLFLKY
jgi:hypothetical protein